MTEKTLAVFENYKIRRHFDKQTDIWYFSVVDVVGALTDSVNPRDYWFKMKIRVKGEDGLELSTICRQLKMKSPIKKEGSESVTNCHQLKLEAADGKASGVPGTRAECLVKEPQKCAGLKTEWEKVIMKDLLVGSPNGFFIYFYFKIFKISVRSCNFIISASFIFLFSSS